MILKSSASLALVVAVVAAPLLTAQAGPKEQKIKAAYLYNFIKFIEWPDNAYSGAGAPINICVLGDENFDGILEKAVSGKEVKGRSVSVKVLGAGAAVPGAADCQVLFVAASEGGRTGEVTGALGGSPVATVGESDGFATAGGVLNFAIDGGKIKVELNMGAAEKAGLKVSGKLQQVATAVGG
jgi:hypothetical protein